MWGILHLLAHVCIVCLWPKSTDMGFRRQKLRLGFSFSQWGPFMRRGGEGSNRLSAGCMVGISSSEHQSSGESTPKHDS